jgi:hypothetical protein
LPLLVAAAEAEAVPEDEVEAGALLPLLPVEAEEPEEDIVIADMEEEPVVVAMAAPLVVAALADAVAQVTALGTVTPLARQSDWAN